MVDDVFRIKFVQSCPSIPPGKDEDGVVVEYT